MAVMGKVGIVMAFITSFIHVTLAISGHATSYKGTVFPSSCNNTKVSQANNLVAAVSTSMFRDGYSCGIRYYVICVSAEPKIRYPCGDARESVIVTVVDVCQSCHGFDILLSKEAFSKIAAPNAEEIFIDYSRSSTN
ncbi:hypothetical protein ACH5RR_003698 [Cinchona calisaya]|uniref:Expansin-like EG45 domain-containing protein n=1 Tax=Cinchona calisaya TaxID=153742 RepID=A0ABD3AVH3_9GENT